MYQVVYTSRANQPLSDSAVQAICRRSAASNAVAGVTGLLLFDGQRFIQALEGERTAIEVVMARVLSDLRHGSISYLAHGPITCRQFGSWSMDYKHADDPPSSQDFMARVKADVEGVRDSSLKAAFIGFASLSADRSTGCHLPTPDSINADG